MTLEQRMQQLKAMQPKIDVKILSACQNATLRAIEKATEMTPVGLEKPLSGANTLASNMKQDWAAKSKYIPQKNDGQYKTYLNNDMQYASYVNDGHRMDRHFVPGLVIDKSGMLSINPDGSGGIVVGAKTPYVPGLFMVEAAKEEYSRVVKTELADLEAIFQ